MGRKEEFNLTEVCRKDVTFLEKGKGLWGKI